MITNITDAGSSIEVTDSGTVFFVEKDDIISINPVGDLVFVSYTTGGLRIPNTVISSTDLQAMVDSGGSFATKGLLKEWDFTALPDSADVRSEERRVGKEC